MRQCARVTTRWKIALDWFSEWISGATFVQGGHRYTITRDQVASVIDSEGV